MFSRFDEESQKVLVQAKKEMSLLKHPYVGSEHLILAILKNENLKATKILNKYNVTYDKFKNELLKIIGEGKEKNEWYLFTPLLKRIIEDAIIICKKNNEEEVLVEHILSALFEEGEGVAIRILLYMKIDIDELSKEIILKKQKKIKGKKKLIIEDYGYDMNEKSKNNELDPVVGREEELNRIIEILGRRTKNNPLLIGEAGVGKTAIVEELSSRIIKGNIPNKLKNKRIISISMSSLIAGTKYRGEFEERINKMLKEVEESEEIILFIDEIHTLVGAGGAEGAIDASNILKPFLARGKIKLIGATTISEYKKYLEGDKALERRFQTVLIEEPSTEKTLEILKKIRPIYESYHNVKVNDQVLKTIVDLTDKYLNIRKQPDKSIDILDEASSKASIIKDKNIEDLELKRLKIIEIRKEKNQAIIKHDFNKATEIKKYENNLEKEISKLELRINKNINKKEVTKEMVAEIVKLKSNIPIYEILSEDLSKLDKAEKTIKNKVVGQDEIIKEVCNSIKKIKLGYTKQNKVVSYFFVGSSGVGKTLLAKEISNLLYNKKLIKLDMSEYKEEHSISKIIGSPPGYAGFDNKKTVLEKIKDNPNCIILLDEIEKANKSVINLFLQILDEGKINTSDGEEIRMNNSIIIMTSNIGFKNNNLGFNNKKDSYIYEKVKEELGVEITNRMDKIFVFNKLTKKDITKIVTLEIQNIRKEFKEKLIDISIKNSVITKIVELSDYKNYGARKINKIINDKLYDLIIEEMMKNNVNIVIETV